MFYRKDFCTLRGVVLTYFVAGYVRVYNTLGLNDLMKNNVVSSTLGRGGGTPPPPPDNILLSDSEK